MKILNICIGFSLINAFFTCQSANGNEHIENKKCVNSIPIIFDTGKVSCLSDFPLLSELKIPRLNSTVGVIATKQKLFSLARNSEYEVSWNSWGNESERANDERAITSCQKVLDEKLSKLEYKRSGDEKCLLNVSIDRVVKNVRNQVAELAKSVGHEQVPAIYDQVLGDFYFKK